ncbi:hypothetical protein K8R03_04740 [Candidatus Kaiserbacteria bacterium]|nr:hypothetical protein [Candidatus Kaiserbacteria bacterium]
MNIPRILYSLLALAFGVFMIVYGERDDSPGAQMLGLVLALAGIYGFVKSRKKKSD